MISISIRHNLPAVAKQLDQLSRDVGDVAMRRALNKTIVQGETAMARAISKEFRVKVGEAKARLQVKRATAKGVLQLQVSLSATKAVKGRGMNLIHFAMAAPKRTRKGTLRQMKFKIKRAGGAKTIKGAFVGTNRKTGGTAVFIREGKTRMPIKTLTTIDIPQMFNTKRINKAVREVMLDKFSANFQREVRVVLKGFAR